MMYRCVWEAFWLMFGKYQQRVARIERRLQKLTTDACNCDQGIVVTEIEGETYDPPKFPPCSKHGFDFKKDRAVVHIDI